MMGTAMMKTFSRMMLAAAAATLAVTPIAAQAGTRASDNGAVYSVSQPGLGREAEGEEFIFGLGFLLSFLIVSGTVLATVVFVETVLDQSPGT